MFGIVVVAATLTAFGAVAQQRGGLSARAQAPSFPQSGHQTEPVDLNEGRSPAELFQAGCAVCHQNAGALTKGRREGELVGFLRQHYTSSSQHASTLARFLMTNVRSAPTRQTQPDRPPAPVGRRPADDERKPQEAARPQEAVRQPDREPASKRKPPAVTPRAASAAPPPPEPAPEASAEAGPAVVTPPPPPPPEVEEKPPAPQIPL